MTGFSCRLRGRFQLRISCPCVFWLKHELSCSRLRHVGNSDVVIISVRMTCQSLRWEMQVSMYCCSEPDKRDELQASFIFIRARAVEVLSLPQGQYRCPWLATQLRALWQFAYKREIVATRVGISLTLLCAFRFVSCRSRGKPVSSVATIPFISRN